MTHTEHEYCGEWDRGWEEHRIRQLRRFAALPFSKKLEWLEDAQETVDWLRQAADRASAGPDATPGDP